MFRKEAPVWVVLGGAALACNAGFINVVGFMGVQQQAISHLSGTLSIIGIETVRADPTLLIRAILVVGFFFLGCVISGFVLRQSVLKLGRSYGVILAGESLLLVGAIYFFKHGSPVGDYLASMACGLQNAMATSYSGAVIRTTHMTGIVTDLGIALGHQLRGQPVEAPRMRLYGALLGGFVIGGILGAAGFSRFGYDTLLFPAALCGLTGLGYFAFKHYALQVKA